MICSFSVVSSDSGNAGSRSTSIASASTSGRFSRVLWMFAEARPAPPPTLSWLCSRASSSWISWRDLLRVPRISICVVNPASAPASAQAVLVAVVEADQSVDGVAARLLRQHDELDAARQVDARDARLDVRRSRIERLAFGADLVAFVALQHRRDVGPRRNLAAIGLAGNEKADRAIRALEILARGALRRLGGRGANAIAIEEHQSPVADRRPAAELDRDGLRVVHLLLEARHRLVANAFDFVGRDRVFGEHRRAWRSSRRAPRRASRPRAPLRRRSPCRGRVAAATVTPICEASPVSTSALYRRPEGTSPSTSDAICSGTNSSCAPSGAW